MAQARGQGKLAGACAGSRTITATAAGVGLTVLVGTGLMGLIFLSNRTGHDEDAAHGGQNEAW